MNAARQKAEEFFERLDRKAIVEAIRRAESAGRGEIRIHLHHGRVADARALAEKTFTRLGMEKTELRSGCLVFIAPEERAFAVIGDVGIHHRVEPTFWLDARDAAATLFAQGKFTEGIVTAVDTLGRALAQHFPHEKGTPNPNELSDEVTED